MMTERFGVKPREHIPGPVIHAYLEAYAQEFGIDKHVRLNTKVLQAKHLEEGGWILQVTGQAGSTESPKEILAKRLIIATGLVSEPFMPHIEGQEHFDRPLFHVKDFRQNQQTIQSGKRVTIFGGSKAAWDAVYAYATEGVQVDWIIRRQYSPCFQCAGTSAD